MLVIRLRRIGKRNKPTYRVVAAEHTATPTGKFIIDFGFYNPHTKEKGLNIELVLEWLKKGARPSNTVSKLLRILKVEHSSVKVVQKKKQPDKKTVLETETTKTTDKEKATGT